jgi:hypothetical protein
MHKFTIFTVLFSLVVIAVIAELLVNGYLRKEPQEDNPGYASSIAPNILEADGSNISPETPSSSISPSEEKILRRHIDETLLSNLGFQNPLIKEVPFTGSFFQLLDISTYGINDVLKYNLFDGNEFFISVNEIPQENATLAREVYRLLRELGEADINLTVNETNQYGGASLYFNHERKKKTAFLVVVIDDTVYGFEYPHTSHNFTKAILSALGSPAGKETETVDSDLKNL